METGFDSFSDSFRQGCQGWFVRRPSFELIVSEFCHICVSSLLVRVRMGWMPCFIKFLQNAADENATASHWHWITFWDGLANYDYFGPT